MSEKPYFERVVDLLRAHPKVEQTGFTGEDVQWYGKGRDHSDLMVITKPSWTLLTLEGGDAGYKGVNVHFEARGPGHLQIDCELTPRLGSEAKADQEAIAPLLELKKEVTQLIWDLGPDFGLDALGANTRNVRKDPGDPSSLKVLGFGLELADGHTPEQFVEKVIPILEAATPMIDQLLTDRGSKA